MELFGFIQDYFLGYNTFFYWRNILEILFFTLLMYYFSLWLKQDRRKNLLPYFYGYCALILISSYTQLTTINYFLFLFAPVAVMLFIMLHQTTLQRNFVALRNITPAKNISKNWQHDIIRSFLLAINNNKAIHCVIENKDSLDDFIHSPLILHANIQQGLIHILQDSHTFDPQKMIWINTSGQLVGINATWKELVFQSFDEYKEQQMSPWEQSALLLSSKTDTLFLRITPIQRSFDIIFNGKIVHNVDSNNALKIIIKYSSTKFWSSDTKITKGDLINEVYTQKNLFKQRSN